MRADLLDEVRQFLPALEATQTELAALFDEKRSATRSANARRMLALAELETGLVKRLESQLEQRRRILERAREQGIAADSIETLVTQIGGSERDTLQKKIDVARERANRLRSESWSQWVTSQRALLHYSELIELIAHCGQPSPVYGTGPMGVRSGGALLDASA